MVSLTIVIPTFDRNDKLKRTIESLLPQLQEGVELLVIDNCSKTPVSITISEYLSEKVKVTRNKQNIGMAGNFARCFELCNTKWLWIIGDDDPMKLDAVSKAIDILDRNTELSFVNFKSVLAPQRMENFTVSSQAELADKLDSFGNFLYISLCIYNTQKLASGYRYLYQYGYTFAPHIALVVSCLRDVKSNHEYLFSKEEVVDNSARDTVVEETWNWIGLSLAIFLIYELTFGLPKYSAKKLQAHLASHVIKPKRVYSEIAKVDPYLNDFDRDLYWFDQIFMRAKKAMTSKDYISFLYYRCRIMLKKVFVKKLDISTQQISVYERF